MLHKPLKINAISKIDARNYGYKSSGGDVQVSNLIKKLKNSKILENFKIFDESSRVEVKLKTDCKNFGYKKSGGDLKVQLYEFEIKF